jgi:hypothetical protein
VATKFPEWFSHKRICTLTAYWEESPSKYSPWAALHWVQRCCDCWKHFWNSCRGIPFNLSFFFWMSLIPWSFYPFKADFIYGNSRKFSKPNQGNMMGVSLRIFGPESAWELKHCHGVETKFGLNFSSFSLFLPKFSCTTIILILTRLSESTRFRTFSTFLSLLQDL